MLKEADDEDDEDDEDDAEELREQQHQHLQLYPLKHSVLPMPRRHRAVG